MTGPPAGIAQTLSGTVGKPVTLTLWASDAPTQVHEVEDALAVREPRVGRGAWQSDAVAIIGSSGHQAAPERGAATPAPAPDITVNWRKHRGPGDVTFARTRIPLVTKRRSDAVPRSGDHSDLHGAGRIRHPRAGQRHLGRRRRRRAVLLDDGAGESGYSIT